MPPPKGGIFALADARVAAEVRAVLLFTGVVAPLPGWL